MFSIDCIQNKGVPLSVCKHNYFVGTCCRLPDYNNFVGIVYDLRDTENANQLVEARKFSSSSSSTSFVSSSLPPSPSSSSSSPTVVSASAAASIHTQQQESTHGPLLLPLQSSIWTTAEAQAATAASQSFTTHNPISSPTTNSTPSPSTTTSSPPSAEREAISAAKDAELAARYIISSTSLFPSPAASPTTTSSPQSGISSAALESLLEQVIGQKQQMNSVYAIDEPNVTGHQEQLQMQSVVFANNHQQLSSTLRPLPPAQAVVTSSIQDATSTSPTTTQPDNNFTTTSRVFQLASTAQQQPTSDQEFTISSASTSSQADQSNSDSDRTQPPTEHPTSSSSATTYEFRNDNTSAQAAATLALSQYQYQYHQSASSSVPASSSSSISSTSLSSSSPLPSSIQPIVDISSHSSSPFVDLVSSNAAQTTTPFTTSLSTALLPNVSSHPWSPTAPPSVQVSSSPLVSTPAQAIKFSSTSQRPPLNSSSNGSEHAIAHESGPTSSSTSSSSTSSSSSPSPSTTSSQPSSLASSATPNLGQLYSNQHSNSNQHTDSHHHHHHQYQQSQHRPQVTLSNLAGLQAASKIVTGSSSSNNLIPSLSGLQSAILSHIPFKIASGLSSGLSNYLQAAMKPSSNRPLLSSNNAPSLQYQQQMQANATKQQQQQTGSATTSNASGVRFPSISIPSAPDSLESNNILNSALPNGTTNPPLPSSVSTWLIQTTGASSSTTPSSTQMSPNLHDIVKEAQLVCGRPQVNSAESKKRVARIVGGNQSLFGQWPWMVSLRQWRKGAFLHKCGAALLNENWAITAAHCVEK